jgi:hypothetical protein
MYVEIHDSLSEAITPLVAARCDFVIFTAYVQGQLDNGQKGRL